MNEVTLDKDLRIKLQNLDQQIAFLDENGKPLGFFVPLEAYKRILSTIPLPFSEEELQRRKAEPGGCSLEEIWKHLGVK